MSDTPASAAAAAVIYAKDVPRVGAFYARVADLIFPVASLAAARTRAAQAGGMLKPAECEWALDGHRRCDGHDPESNVFQLRERVA